MNQITIGFAGHIDHGKTSLVQALTGKNTDNLKEEIQRGMTINIGFAHLNQSISLIDVPGHERFVKNMVAGVSSIDFAVLVVAADDGVMPQTIEHLEILNLLGVKNGIVIINKIDLSESGDWLDLVELDIIDVVKGTFLEGCKIFRVSTISNEGINDLKEYLKKINIEKYKKFERDIFRMFIDRSFIVKGFGTIVTGTVLSGSISKGESVELLPYNIDAKVRGLQSKEVDINMLGPGSRAAVNLHFNNKINIKRGDHLSLNGYFKNTKNIIAKISLLSKVKDQKLKNNQRVRINLGTQETIGRVLLLSSFSKKSLLVLIKLEKEIIVSFKDRFIIRNFSPITTIAGGEVLDYNLNDRWKEILLYSKKLSDCNSDIDLISTILENNYKTIYTYESLSMKIGISEKLLKKKLQNSKSLYRFENDTKWIVTKNQYEFYAKKIVSFLNSRHIDFEFREGVLKEEINEELKFNFSFLEIMLDCLCKEKKIKIKNNIYSEFNFKINLSKNEISIKNDIFKILNESEFNPPGIDEISEILNIDKNKVSKLLKIESSIGNIIIINEKIFLTNDSYNKLIKIVEVHFEKIDTLNIKQFKSLLDTTRKYAVPFLEFLDKQKVTYRFGNERKINK